MPPTSTNYMQRPGHRNANSERMLVIVFSFFFFNKIQNSNFTIPRCFIHNLQVSRDQQQCHLFWKHFTGMTLMFFHGAPRLREMLQFTKECPC